MAKEEMSDEGTTAIDELDVEDLRLKYKQLQKSAAREASGRDRKISELQEEVEALKAGLPGDQGDSDNTEAVQQVAEAMAELKGRAAVVALKEHALERAEAENIPFGLALKLAAKDTETTDKNLDALVDFADKTFDKAVANAWVETGSILGDRPVRLKNRDFEESSGKKGRGLKVQNMSADELGRIPRSLRDKLRFADES